MLTFEEKVQIVDRLNRATAANRIHWKENALPGVYLCSDLPRRNKGPTSWRATVAEGSSLMSKVKNNRGPVLVVMDSKATKTILTLSHADGVDIVLDILLDEIKRQVTPASLAKNEFKDQRDLYDNLGV